MKITILKVAFLPPRNLDAALWSTQYSSHWDCGGHTQVPE